ncbi:MAG TPA: enoyl-CoA hydratase/isomerase family protein [Sporichthya sp.]|jgi:enoyl-CoA hydratase|nr:enoyl-CoA hydratase/isomerase family protein [Sporichthya sp.]
MTYRDYSHLDCGFVEDGILRISFTNPGRMNSVTEGQHTELARIFRDIDRDDTVRVALVTGSDGTFSAGGDFDLVQKQIDSWEARVRMAREVRDIVYGVIECSKPVVAAVEGTAVGAGLSVALLADVCVITPDAKIIDGHTRLGVAAGDHAVMVWPIACGIAKAKYYLLTCKALSGAEAERSGLVALCVPPEDLHATALKTAQELAALPAQALAWTKHALNGWLRSAGESFDLSLAYELIGGFSGPESKEGLAALKEKRRPNFPSLTDLAP